jgi:excisionase family DNA binding protein
MIPVKIGCAMERAALSVADSAVYLGVSKRTIWSMIRRGELESVLLGRRRLIRRDELDRVLAERTIPRKTNGGATAA